MQHCLLGNERKWYWVTCGITAVRSLTDMGTVVNMYHIAISCFWDVLWIDICEKHQVWIEVFKNLNDNFKTLTYLIVIYSFLPIQMPDQRLWKASNSIGPSEASIHYADRGQRCDAAKTTNGIHWHSSVLGKHREGQVTKRYLRFQKQSVLRFHKGLLCNSCYNKRTHTFSGWLDFNGIFTWKANVTCWVQVPSPILLKILAAF